MTKLKVSSPAELISAVPFLIGFHPADSLTVVAMRGPEIAFAVRTDLPEPGTPAEEAKAAVLHLAAVVIRQEVQAVAIIGYGDNERATPALLRLSDVFRKVGLVIIEELRVEDGRFWSLLCTDPSCCPPDGLPCEPPDSVVAAEATFAGAVALPNRETLAEQVQPVTGDDREAMTAATQRAVQRLAALAAEDFTPVDGAAQGDCARADPGTRPVRERTPRAEDETHFFQQVRRAGRQAIREAERRYSTGLRLTDDEAAWLGLLLLHVPVRDYAWTRTRTYEWELALWSDVVRRVDPAYAPAPAALLAFVAWRSGSGVLASVAVERALAEQEDYTLAVLVHEALVTGLHPRVMDGWPAVPGAPEADAEDAAHDEESESSASAVGPEPEPVQTYPHAAEPA